jgi:hypothetical protein
MKEVFSTSRDQKATIFSLSKQLHETEKANIYYGQMDKERYQALEQKHKALEQKGMDVITAAAATLGLAEAKLGSTEAKLKSAEKARDKEKMELEVHAKELDAERDEHERTKASFIRQLQRAIDKEKNTSEEHSNLQVAVGETSKKYEEEISALRQLAAMPVAERVPGMLDAELGELERVVHEERAKRHQAALECAICLDRPKDTALGCGHQACSQCAQDLQDCHICQQSITLRIRLYRN